jgi:beta-glucosidase-like glycosyl hydrolase
VVDTREHRLLSLQVAEQAMTLLKNDPPASPSHRARDGAAGKLSWQGNTPLLPLSKTAKIAMVGPQANFTMEMLSNYEGANLLVLKHSPFMAHCSFLNRMWHPRMLLGFEPLL